MILKVDRQSFPMVPKSGPKVVVIMELLHLKTISHFRLRTLYFVFSSMTLTEQTDRMTYQGTHL